MVFGRSAPARSRHHSTLHTAHRTAHCTVDTAATPYLSKPSGNASQLFWVSHIFHFSYFWWHFSCDISLYYKNCVFFPNIIPIFQPVSHNSLTSASDDDGSLPCCAHTSYILCKHILNIVQTHLIYCTNTSYILYKHILYIVQTHLRYCTNTS